MKKCMNTSIDEENMTEKNQKIFVFGSNLAGRHGKGAAKTAVDLHGAIEGKGIGIQGNAYGIPTKDGRKNTPPLHRPGAILPKHMILVYVQEFGRFTWQNPDLEFQVTRIGCGLAGFKDEEIAPMFAGCNPFNTFFDTAWKPYIPSFFQFWGTFE